MTNSILRGALDKAALWSRVNSPWLVHFNSGSCNGCDIEILATLAPRYDLERFGVKLQGSPRHADVLICTGPVTRLARERLLRTYEQIAGAEVRRCRGFLQHHRRRVPRLLQYRGRYRRRDPRGRVRARLPPRPEAIIDGVVQLLKKLRGSAAGGRP